MLPEPIAVLLAEQAGVVARQQLLELGARPHDIERWRRRKDLVVVHPGVYVDHTGELSWLQRAWSAVLLCAPAALCHGSAIRGHEGPGRPDADAGPIHVAVDVRRHPEERPGIVVHRKTQLREQVWWHVGPPRQRYDHAVLDVAVRTERELDVIGVLAAAVQGRRTTAQRLLELCRSRERLPGRHWMEGVLRDVAEGSTSVLEHGYRTRVERAHDLPSARRQRPADTLTGLVYRDAEYGGSLVVELDGRLHHGSAAQRDADLERDLDAALTGRDTVRLGWGQVFDRPCATAAKVARLLQVRRLGRAPRTCSPDCQAPRWFELASADQGRERP